MAGFPNLAQLMGGDIVTVYVGPREKRYSVHKALLTSQSEYFEKALNGKFKEADEQTIRLPEDSPDAFDLLIGWLYQNQIPVLGYGPGPFDEFPRGLVVGATKLGDAPLPANHGTGSVSYIPHEETSASLFPQPPANNNLIDRFNHIGCQLEYKLYSSDELRLADYALGQRFSDFSRPPPDHVATQDPFPVSRGHIDGIPHCSPIEPIMASEEAHQLALIRLCLFAETICWTSLFNIAMSTYMQGESFLAPRPMPTEHIELIYERAHPESPCRKFAADATISQINAAGQIDRNMDLVEQWPSFLEDIFKRLRLSQDLSLTHRPKSKGPCEYHVHDTKDQPDKCSAASESRNFILDSRAPAKSRFVANPKSNFGGVIDSENGSRGDGKTTGSSGEIRYTTYRPNAGYTTTTLGYDDTTGGPPYDTFGRPSDNMDWGSGWRPWLKGGGFGETQTPGFGFGGSGGSGGFGTAGPSFGTPRPGSGTGPPPPFGIGSPFGSFGAAAAPNLTNPTTTASSSSSSQGGGSGPTGPCLLPPQVAATAPVSGSSSLPRVPTPTEPTISATSLNTPASTTSPAIATSASGSSEAGVTSSISQAPNPTFGEVSPLASPLPSLTAKSIGADGIFGQRQSSSSSTTSPGLFSATSTPLPPSSTSGTDTSKAAPPSTIPASTSPFALLGARPTPAPNSFSLFGSLPRASDSGAPKPPSSGLFRPTSTASDSGAPAKPSPAGLFGSTSRASDSGATAKPTSSGLFGSTSRASDSGATAKPTSFGLFGSTSIASDLGATTKPPSSGLFGSIGSTSIASNADAAAKAPSPGLFGLRNESNISPSNVTSTFTTSNSGGRFGSTSIVSDANIQVKSSSSNLFGAKSKPDVLPSNITSTAAPPTAKTLFG